MDLRSVEVAWRAGWMRAIAAGLPGPRAVAPPHWGARPHRVLLVRCERIGDMIMATGLVRALARSHATIALDVLTTPAAAPVLAGSPYVSELLVFDKRRKADFPAALRALRVRRYDAVVDGRINNPRTFTSTPLLMLAARAPYRVGAHRWPTAGIYNIQVPWTLDRQHYVDASAHLAEPFGVSVGATDWHPELFVAPREAAAASAHWPPVPHGLASPRVLVNLSASEAMRRWPDERFVQVARHLRRRLPGARFAVIAQPTEWASVEAVARASGGVPVRTPLLRHALALVRSADLVLTPDTSISHAASALCRPAVVLLKRSHRRYGPYKTPGRTVLWEGDTIRALAVGPVVDALDATLAETGLAEAVPVDAGERGAIR